MDNKQLKKNLRITYKQIRNEQHLNEKTKKDQHIQNMILESDLYKKADIVLTYLSYQSEVGTSMILFRAKQDKKQVYVPKVENKTEMNFFYYNEKEPLIRSNYGILEPINTRKFEYSNQCRYMVIVPLLAFNEKNYRLGYGGGYYDRFLSNYVNKSNVCTVGLSYECCKTKVDFQEPFDQPIDFIFTECGVLKK